MKAFIVSEVYFEWLAYLTVRNQAIMYIQPVIIAKYIHFQYSRVSLVIIRKKGVKWDRLQARLEHTSPTEAPRIKISEMYRPWLQKSKSFIKQHKTLLCWHVGFFKNQRKWEDIDRKTEAETEGDTSGITAGPNPARLEGCCYCKTQKELL